MYFFLKPNLKRVRFFICKEGLKSLIYKNKKYIMNEHNLYTMANFLAKHYYPKKYAPITSKETLKDINNNLDQFNLKFNTNFKRPIGEGTFRKIIAIIRKEYLLKDNGSLMASSKGYYISYFKEDTLDQAASLEGRINEMLSVIKALRTTALHQQSRPKKTIVEYNNKPIIGDLFDSL